jgi:hypothetical protein
MWSDLSFDAGSFDPESWGPSWGLTWEAAQELLLQKTGGGHDSSDSRPKDPIKPRYRPAIREADARKDYAIHQPAGASQQDGIAIPAPQGYDSIGAQVAPKVGASPVLHAVAPELKDVVKGIQITQQVLQGITSAAALKLRQRQDDEAAMLVLFALMMDDD